MVSCETKVHPSLKAHAFASAHFDIWDDLICHALFTANGLLRGKLFQSPSAEAARFGNAYLVCLAISSRTLGISAFGISINVCDESS